MKDPIPFDEGRVVQSIQGRDRGYYFLVTQTARDGTVFVADGDRHRLERPKKKKTKHLRAKPVRLCLETLRPEGGRLQDSDLRRALAAGGFANKHSLRMESPVPGTDHNAQPEASEKEG